MRSLQRGTTWTYKFPTFSGTTRLGVTFSGTPQLDIYREGNTTPIVTLSVANGNLVVDYNSKTGLNEITVDMSDQTKFIPGKYFSIVCKQGTIDGVSAAQGVLLNFGIETADDGRVSRALAVAVSNAGPATITLASGEGALVTPGDFIKVFIADGNGPGQVRMVASVAGDECALDRLWTTLPVVSGSQPTYSRYPGSLPSTAAEIAAALQTSAATTPIPADAKKMNAGIIYGSGAPGDLWRGTP